MATYKSVQKMIINAAKGGLFIEGERIMGQAKNLTPVDIGNLRASGFVEPPKQSGSAISINLGFGGASAPYAVYVHENMNAHHPVGQAKFLETAVKANAREFPKRLAEHISRGMK